MVLSATASAAFVHPEGWVETGKNIVSVNSDGTVPAEKFVAENRDKDSTALLVYQAGSRPEVVPATELFHAAIDKGFQGQLAAP